jgi:hypothetical protein
MGISISMVLYNYFNPWLFDGLAVLDVLKTTLEQISDVFIIQAVIYFASFLPGTDKAHLT